MKNIHDANYYYEEGLVAYKLGCNKEAINYFNKAIELEPNKAIYHNNKANVLSILGNNQEAIDCLDIAIKLDPMEANYYYNKGSALFTLNNNQEALNYLDTAINLKSNKAIYHDNRGRVLSVLGNNIEAIKALHKAADLYGVSQNKEALACYKEILGINPQDAKAYCNIGNILYVMKSIQESVEYYDMAILNAHNERYIDAYIGKNEVFNILGLKHDYVQRPYNANLSIIKTIVPEFYNEIKENTGIPNVLLNLIISYAIGEEDFSLTQEIALSGNIVNEE